MMITDYLLPQQRAALYELLAQTPGLTVVHSVANMQGTVGVGVSGPWKGKATIIFDPTTYAPLGWNQDLAAGQHSGEVPLKLAIVNKARQLP
jgi:hypothetical protein